MLVCVVGEGLILSFLSTASFLEELDSSPIGEAEDMTSSRCRAASLATMAWALSHTKHKRKFVEANKGSLLRLAAECKGRCAAVEGGCPGLHRSPGRSIRQ